MEAQLKRAGMPSPQVIGIDEIAIRKGHTYRIVVSDPPWGRPIWFGGKDRSEASMGEFAELGKKKSSRIRLAVMDMWAVSAGDGGACAAGMHLFDKFHVMRHLEPAGRFKSEYGRLAGAIGCQGPEIHIAVAQGRKSHARWRRRL